MSTEPIVSVVIPVKNGSGKLHHCLASLLRQDVPRATYEVIVADGRSKDDTVEIARSYGCIVVDNPRETVAGGRNAGIAMARGRYIAFTEDDIVLPPGWMSAGLLALEDESVAAVGGPTPIPQPSPPFARAVDLIFRAAAGTGYSVQSGTSSSGREVMDIPGGNAMYRRKNLDTALPINELLVTGEDVELHFRLRAAGNRLVFSPDFLAWHHKRDAPGRFFRQIRRFAQGRVQVWRLHREALRPLHWLAAFLPLPLLLVVSMLWPGQALFFIAGGAATGVTAGLLAGIGWRGSAWLPVVTMLFVLAWPIGLLQELLFPIRDATGR